MMRAMQASPLHTPGRQTGLYDPLTAYLEDAFRQLAQLPHLVLQARVSRGLDAQRGIELLTVAVIASLGNPGGGAIELRPVNGAEHGHPIETIQAHLEQTFNRLPPAVVRDVGSEQPALGPEVHQLGKICRLDQTVGLSFDLVEEARDVADAEAPGPGQGGDTSQGKMHPALVIWPASE